MLMPKTARSPGLKATWMLLLLFACNQDNLPVKELNELKSLASEQNHLPGTTPPLQNPPPGPGLFLLSTNLLTDAGRHENLPLDYQLITSEKHVRMFYPGKIAFDVDFKRQLSGIPALSYQIYSLETQSPLYQGTLSHTRSEGTRHSYEAPPPAFETDTNLMILSVIMKQVMLGGPEHLTGGSIDTRLKLDFEELPAVERSVNITVLPARSPEDPGQTEN